MRKRQANGLVTNIYSEFYRYENKNMSYTYINRCLLIEKFDLICRFEIFMKNFIYIILIFLILFQQTITNRKNHHYNQQQFEELLELLKTKFTNKWKEEIFSNSYPLDKNNDQSIELNDYEQHEVDPNDRVDIDLWNKLNEQDMKKMPVITDYTNEDEAIQWLKWYLRIAKRHSQVK